MGDEGLAATTQAVLAANARFYEAHEANDLAVMEQIWERSERVVCIHPGWAIVRGWHDVIETWRRIFAGPQRLQFILTNVEVAIEATSLWSPSTRTWSTLAGPPRSPAPTCSCASAVSG